MQCTLRDLFLKLNFSFQRQSLASTFSVGTC